MFSPGTAWRAEPEIMEETLPRGIVAREVVKPMEIKAIIGDPVLLMEEGQLSQKARTGA